MDNKVIKISMLILIVIFILIFAATLYCWYIAKPNNILKTAVFKNDIKGSNYILCKPTAVTGFTWFLIENEDRSVKKQYCNIIGIQPKDDLNLNTEFLMANNTYIFYVIDIKEYYSEQMGVYITDYVVSGWDILMTVRHGRTDSFFESKKYVTIKDTQSE